MIAAEVAAAVVVHLFEPDPGSGACAAEPSRMIWYCLFLAKGFAGGHSFL